MKTRIFCIGVSILLASGVRAEAYYLQESDSAGGSSMTGTGTCGGWANASGGGTHKAAVKGKDYVVRNAYSLRTPEGVESCTFAGDSLALENGTVAVKLSDGGTLTIPKLVVTGTGLLAHWTQCYSFSFASDDVEIRTGGVLTFQSGHKNDIANDVRNIDVHAKIRGDGTLQAKGGTWNRTDGDSQIRFNGDLSGFTGRLEAFNLANTKLTVRFTEKAASFLGSPASLDARSVIVTNGVTLSIKESVTFGATRGFYFGGASDGAGKISVDLGKTVTVLGPLSGKGFTKLGPGRLVLKDLSGFDTDKITVSCGALELPDGTVLYPSGYSAAVKTRLVSELVREKGGRDAVLAAAAAVPTLGANGRWDDLDYVTDKGSNWDPHTHVRRCEALAAAIAVGAEQSAAYAGTIKTAMASWYANVPTSSNWWYAQIGIPESVGHTAVLAESALCDDPVYAKMVANLAVSKDHVNAQTGMNLLWVRGIRFVYGLLTYDLAEMAGDADVMASTIAVVESGEGIQTDWCFHQHGAQPQVGNYGLQFLNDQVLWANVFAGESYDYTPAKRDILTDMVANCFEWSVWKGALESGAMGRQIDESVYLKGGAITNAIVGYGRKVGDPRGYRAFDKSAYSIYRSTNWMASVKMGTLTIISSESTNGDNIKGWFLGDGAVWTLARGDEYEHVHALWDDWRMVPGVTQLRGAPLPQGFGEGNKKYRKPTATVSYDAAQRRTTFVYGPEENLSYRKTWTFRDDGYDVCVTNVAVAASAPQAETDVATCIENANACATAGLVVQKDWYSVYRNGEIYYIVFARPDQISFTLEDREGDMHDYVTSLPVGTTVSGRIFQLLVSHGTAPSDAGVAYSVRVGGWDKESFDPMPRTITLAGERRVSGKRRELTLAFSTTKKAWTNALIVAYGATDGGDDLGAWETLEVVTNTVLPETTSLVWTSPASFGKIARYARFFFVGSNLEKLAEYRVYDSMHGDGTAYIDTGLVFHKGDWADLVFRYHDKGYVKEWNPGLFGYRYKPSSGGSTTALAINASGGNFWLQYWDGNATQLKVWSTSNVIAGETTSYLTDRWYTAHLGADKRTLVRDDGVKCEGAMEGDKKRSQYAETPYAGGDFATPCNMYLFWLSGDDRAGSAKDNSPPAKSNYRIRSLKTYDGSNNPTRDYVAVRRISDSAFGMYDRLGKTFYGNAAASGAFTGVDPTDELVGFDLTRAKRIGDSLCYVVCKGLVVIVR